MIDSAESRKYWRYKSMAYQYLLHNLQSELMRKNWDEVDAIMKALTAKVCERQ